MDTMVRRCVLLVNCYSGRLFWFLLQVNIVSLLVLRISEYRHVSGVRVA